MAHKGKYQQTRSRVPKEKPRKITEKSQQAEPQEKSLSFLQKLWLVIKTILTYTIMALAMAMMIFTAISVSSFDRNDRDILGFKAFIVRSDSMSATDFSAGDLVIVRETDASALVPGDIISFRSEDPATLGETFTHKIREITQKEDGTPAFITYGTTTGVDDAYPVSFANVIGKYQLSIPQVGTFFAFMKTTPGYICCIFLPFVLLLLINGGSIIASVRQMYRQKEEEAETARKEKEAALAAQQAVIEKQQKQMEAMLREMKKLRAGMQEKDDT